MDSGICQIQDVCHGTTRFCIDRGACFGADPELRVEPFDPWEAAPRLVLDDDGLFRTGRRGAAPGGHEFSGEFGDGDIRVSVILSQVEQFGGGHRAQRVALTDAFVDIDAQRVLLVEWFDDEDGREAMWRGVATRRGQLTAAGVSVVFSKSSRACHAAMVSASPGP